MGAAADLASLLGVWAHPDDEAYLSAGLMGRVADAGGEVVCSFATVGEAGTDDPGSWPPERLADLRRSELADAMALEGVSRYEVLGHPDGGCAEADARRAVAHLVDLIEEVRPDAIVTFGPDGMTGHPDHRAVSAWATAAWATVARRSANPGRLLYATVTPGFARAHLEWHARIGLFPADGPATVPEDRLALRVELSEGELDRKRAALAAHESQTAPLAALMGEASYRRWWDVERFREPSAAELCRPLQPLAVAGGR
jgi:LmbE family N-acetylglucosaminyl deacetylase